MRRLTTVLSAVLLVIGGLTIAAPGAAADEPPTERRPVVFVHGGAGSGAQFQSQGLRFTSNGYPAGHIRVLEYNSADPASFGTIPGRLDALFDQIQADTGAEQIDLLGHSLGTGLMQAYLSNPARAARVAHYVNIDGAQASAPPGGVPTLALWGRGSPARRIAGATNTYIPDQSHVQVATSREAFRVMYRFFNDGDEPATLDVEPDASGQAEISGRAVLFPANDGAEGVTLSVFEVDPADGERVGDPIATEELGSDGAWGPFTGEVGGSYEIALTRDDNTHHFYLEPLIRDDHLVRLNTSLPGEGIGALVERGPDHGSVTISRYKEWWGGGAPSTDVLEIDGTNVINAATAPITKNAIGVFAYDVGSDGVSNVAAPIPTLFALPFLTGVDLHVPATHPPDRTITVRSVPRDGGGAEQVVRFPAWASENHPVSVHFHDFVQPAAQVSYTARFNTGQCNMLTRFAEATDRTLSEVVGDTLDLLDHLAGLGLAPTTPAVVPPNEGPCEIVVLPEDVQRVEDLAATWMVPVDDLHRNAARLTMIIILGIPTSA